MISVADAKLGYAGDRSLTIMIRPQERRPPMRFWRNWARPTAFCRGGDQDAGAHGGQDSGRARQLGKPHCLCRTLRATCGGQTRAALDSAAHVKVAAKVRLHADHDEILVTLTIDPGYHVNANPASIDYLIPTVVTVPGAPDAKITYPAGQVFKPKFSPEGIAVYEGSVEIIAELPKGRLASAATRRCASRVRLAPRKFVSLRQRSLYLYLSNKSV